VVQDAPDRFARAATRLRIAPGRGRPAATVPWDWSDIGLFLVIYVLGSSLIASIGTSPPVESFGRNLLRGLSPSQQSAVGSLTLQTAVYAVALAIVLILVIGRRHARTADLGWRLPRLIWLPLAAVSAGVALVLLTGILEVIHLVLPSATNGQIPEVQSEYGNNLALAIPAVSVVAPIVEETFFRGFVYGWMRRRLNVPAAAVLSGCFFALVHFQPVIFVPLAVLGAGLALLYEYSGSLLPGMIVHGLFNLVEIINIV